MLHLFHKKSLGEKITLKVREMHCASCALVIDGALEELEGVISAETSYAKATTVVEYDPNCVTPAKVIKEIAKAGYSAHQ